MTDFIATEDRQLLQRHGLNSFDALWALQLEAVDEPNVERGGHSIVCRLELGERAFYLKRQTNHLTRSLLHPFGEPTFAREFRNIQRYSRLGIPALQAAFFAARKLPGESQAILLTRALDGWTELEQLLKDWNNLAADRQHSIILACAALASRLHGAGQMHGCFYPKHIFLREGSNGFEACLIDLEKTRPLRFGKRDRVKDLEPLLRRAVPPWSVPEVRVFLQVYLGAENEVDIWAARLDSRRSHKVARR
mgnify:CR=1 FL=1